jgi:hypothetical protein
MKRESYAVLLITSKALDARRSFDKPLGHESFDPELMTEGLETEWLRINSSDD